MALKVGFAGTVLGMNAAQQAAFLAFIDGNDIEEFRSGGCVGADQQATELICRSTTARVIVCRQPMQKIESPLVRAVAAETIKPARKGASRNKALVDASDVVVLAPKARDKTGGTYSTCLYARWCCKRVVFMWPDGTVEDIQYRPRRWWTEKQAKRQREEQAEPINSTA